MAIIVSNLGAAAMMTIKNLPLLLIVVLTLGCNGNSLDPGVPPTDDDSPPAADLAWWSRAAIDAVLRYSVWRGSRSGYVTLFARDGQPVYASAVGWADIDSQRPMALDTRMRFASMTKPVTAVAAMMLVEQGALDLDDPVARYIPAFSNARVATSQSRDDDGNFPTERAEPQLQIRHLLMFASGIGPGRDESTQLWQHWRDNGPRTRASGTLGDRIEHLATLPLFEHPGQRWRYGWSADVLARVVEVASGQRFDEFLDERIFQPLGMTATTFMPPLAQRGALATVYTQDEHGDLVALVPASDTDYPEGGSGLVSTAGDYMRFALMLWNEGEYRGARILQPATVRQMRQLHVPSGVLETEGIEGVGWGLGMAVTADADASLITDRNGDFWWAGYFGTNFFISPETGLVGIVLSQNEPGPYSDRPIILYIAQALAFAGL
jgi:CubicO group peptidase (beta-lactamase class C family)